MAVSIANPTPQQSVSRIEELADIHRGASLDHLGIRIGYSVSDSKHWSAAFIVYMVPPQGPEWHFVTSVAKVRHFESRLLHMMKENLCQKDATKVSSRGSISSKYDCTVCESLKDQIKAWKKIPMSAAIGNSHLSEKIYRIENFFYKVMQIVALNATYLPSCKTLREIWRMTEEFCHIEYQDEDQAMEQLRPLEPVATSKEVGAQPVEPEDDEECAICLDLVRIPQDPDLAGANGVEMPCGHRFHDSCLCVWFNSSVSCPTCRDSAK